MSSTIIGLITNHAGYAAILLAVLIVAVIILTILTFTYHSKWKSATTAGFDTSAWKYGSVMDQGYFGGGLTPAQLSVYMPQLGGNRSELSRMMMAKRGRNGSARAMRARAMRARAMRARRGGRRERQTTGAPAGEYSPSGEYTATAGVCNAGDMIDSSTGLCGPAGGCDPGDTMDVSTGMCIPSASGSASYAPDANGNCAAGDYLDAGSGMCTNGNITSDFEGADTSYLGDTWMFGGATDTACSATDEYGNPLVYDANGRPIGSTINGQTMPLDSGFFAGYWDPDATAEAQALASVGSYVTDPSGDQVAFQAAISSAYDSDTASGTLSDAQLTALMAGGTAP